MHGWELLVRVIDKSYREFTSKQGKPIILLTLEFIDRTGCIIEGTIFGPDAMQYNKSIDNGKIYRVSKGIIAE